MSSSRSVIQDKRSDERLCVDLNPYTSGVMSTDLRSEESVRAHSTAADFKRFRARKLAFELADRTIEYRNMPVCPVSV